MSGLQPWAFPLADADQFWRRKTQLKKAFAGAVLRTGLAFCLAFAVYGCGGHSAANSTQTSKPTQADASDIKLNGFTPGVTPFIASVALTGQSTADIASITFEIAPKPNTVSKPVNATWTRAALNTAGYLQFGLIQLPIFGLYDGYNNQVSFQINFVDGSTQNLKESIGTTSYTDAKGVFKSPTIMKARTASSSLGFSFFYLKTSLGGPVIVDTDGQLRWVAPGIVNSTSAYYSNGQFYVGSQTSPSISTITLDGTVTQFSQSLPQPLLSGFTHNIDSGTSYKSFIAEFNGNDDLGVSTDDIVAEISASPSQSILQSFDMADILSSYMKQNGDDPTLFVRPGVDWFHTNASWYDPSDDSIIVSSRENFLVKLDYQTGNILWILGDPTKYWYTFPSLRAKALTLDAGGDYPVGQHAVSITSDGYVMVFNDGYPSANQPPGSHAGISRPFSEVSAYSINTAAMTAHQAWKFDYGQSIKSNFCGSSYEAPGKTYLVDFPMADNGMHARLIGLDANHNVAFDFQYDSPIFCSAAWNAAPISLEDLEIN